MVDIHNHEDSLKELSKTSLINNLTLILCWSAQEAARYLELFKSYEHAAPTSIRAHQATSYREKLVEFITVPRSINKTDAVGLVSAFGSIRAAVNARPEEISAITGWGEKKVQRWCETVRQPFRVRKAAARRGQIDNTNIRFDGSRLPLVESVNKGKSPANSRQEDSTTLHNKEGSRIEEEERYLDDDDDDDDENSAVRLPRDAEEVEFAQNGDWTTGGQGKSKTPDNNTFQQPHPDAIKKTPAKRAAPEDSPIIPDSEDDEEEALFLAAAAEVEGDDGPSTWLLHKKKQQPPGSGGGGGEEEEGEETRERSLLLSPTHSSSSFRNPSQAAEAAVGMMNDGMMMALAKLREK